MELKFSLFIIFNSIISSLTLLVLEFEINELNFQNKKYSPTEFLNIYFKSEYYTPLQLGNQNKYYFGLISFDYHFPVLSTTNCEKINLFQKNKNIIKDKYLISSSNTSKYLGNGSDTVYDIDFAEVYSEIFTYYNSTTINNNYKNKKKA